MTYSFTNEVVRASAGSGKTFKLSERYLKLILLGEKVDSILATTFTRKAAGEIQDRILLRLGRGANSLEGARELYDQLIKDEPEFERVVADLYGLDQITPEKAQALFQDKLEEVTRSLQKIRVSTLDSFFMQIAGGYAFEIGLPPNWKIVEEIENERILYAALLHTFSQAKNYPVQNEKTAHTDEVNAAVTLARLLFKGDLKRSIEGQITDLITATLEIYRNTKSNLSAWTRLESDVESEFLNSPQVLIENLKGLEDEYPKNKPKSKSDVATVDKRFYNAVVKTIELFENEDYAAVIKATLPQNSITTGTFNKKELSDNVADAVKQIFEYSRIKVLQDAAQTIHATCGVLNVVAGYFEESKREKGAYRFDDLTRVILDNLSRENSLTRLLYRLDAQTSHILLDEFQDASFAQWGIIRPFAQSILTRNDSQTLGSFFCVGDVKQAIYGWRGGKAEIFDSIKRGFEDIRDSAGEEKIKDSSLPKNWRSSPVIVNVVNQLFLGQNNDGSFLNNEAFHPQDKEPDPYKNKAIFDGVKRWISRFEEHQCAERNESLSGYWSLEQAPRVVDGLTPSPNLPPVLPSVESDPIPPEQLKPVGEESDEDDEDNPYSESASSSTANKLQKIATLNYAIERIVQLRVDNPNASIGVLARTNKTIGKIVSRLKKHRAIKEGGFEISEEGGTPLTDSPAVNAILSVLKFAEHSGDSVASFHIASVPPLSERFEITADNYDKSYIAQKRASYIRSLIETKGLGDFIAEIRDLLLSSCSEKRDKERLDKLVEFAYSYVARTERTLVDEFLETVRKEKFETPSEGQLRVMSLHKSKGLEFDIVVLPELDYQLDRKRDSFYLHYESADPKAPLTDKIDGIVNNIPSEALLKLQDKYNWLTETFEFKLMEDVQEALSLLYVGITRPIRALIAVIPPPGNSKSSSLTFAQILRKGLGEAENPNVQYAQILFQSGDPHWSRADQEKKLEPPLTPERQRPLFVSREDAKERVGIPDVRLLYHRTTPTASPETHLWSSAKEEALTGTALHACFEQVTWLDDGMPNWERLQTILAAIFDGDHDKAAKTYEQFKRICELDFTKKLLSRASYPHEAKVFQERQFSFTKGDTLIRGTIDRLTLLYDEGRLVGADVIDFKSNKYVKGETHENYDKQLQFYGEAVANLFQLGSDQINLRYVFIGEDWPEEEREHRVTVSRV